EPDAGVQSLCGCTTNHSGGLSPVILNPLSWQTLPCISSAFLQAGYSLHLSHPPLDAQQEANTIRELKRQHVDGLILMAAVRYLLPGLTDYLREAGRPIVEITATKAEFDHVIHRSEEHTSELQS